MGEHGPYIVMHRDRYPLPGSNAPYGRLHSREAVADLSTKTLTQALGESFDRPEMAVLAISRVGALYPEGGKVSLPDGSEVEVEATTWTNLIEDLSDSPIKRPQLEHRFSRAMRSALLAAWNSEHGVPAERHGEGAGA